jgi:SET domain-containing protein
MVDNTTYSAPGLRVVTSRVLGRGVVAERAFAKGEVIAIWRGRTITEHQALTLSTEERDQLLQIGDDQFLVNDEELLPVDFINHSCEPNCGFTDATTLVAMRDIKAGESVTFDYAMSDTNSFITFNCHCGSPICRARMSGTDWKLAQLQERYAGWFAPHVARLIASVTEPAGDH